MHETLFTDSGVVLLGNVSGYTHMFIQFTTVAECEAEWGIASKAEREQIAAFITANGSRFLSGKGAYRAYRVWTLCRVRHQDTGRMFLSCAVGPDWVSPGGGLCLAEIRKVCDLKPVKGGDYKIVKPTGPQPPGLPTFAGEPGTPIKAGVRERLPSRSSRPVLSGGNSKPARKLVKGGKR